MSTNGFSFIRVSCFLNAIAEVKKMAQELSDEDVEALRRIKSAMEIEEEKQGKEGKV